MNHTVKAVLVVEDNEQRKVLAEGCDGHIPKPISVPNFLETVGRFAA